MSPKFPITKNRVSLKIVRFYHTTVYKPVYGIKTILLLRDVFWNLLNTNQCVRDFWSEHQNLLYLQLNVFWGRWVSGVGWGKNIPLRATMVVQLATETENISVMAWKVTPCKNI